MVYLKHQLINKFKTLRSPYLKAIIKDIYYALTNRPLYRAHKHYKFTDEYLKYVHILEAINYAKVSQISPIYFEFGCHSGRTFSAAVRAAKYLKISDMQFYAFDSFQGLPETKQNVDGIFTTGSFNTNKDDFIYFVKAMSGLTLENQYIMEGFYENSLTKALQLTMPKVGVVHIDVDLYSSTVEVLKFIKPLLMIGSVLLFDDWYCFSPGTNKGEARALQEFCDSNPGIKLEAWKNYSTFGKSFFVTNLD